MNGHVLETALEQFAVDLAQFFFVFNRKNDRIGLRVNISGGRFAGCMNDLSGQKAKRQIAANDDVVIKRNWINVTGSSQYCSQRLERMSSFFQEQLADGVVAGPVEDGFSAIVFGLWISAMGQKQFNDFWLGRFGFFVAAAASAGVLDG